MPRPSQPAIHPHELSDETEGDGMHPIADPRQTTRRPPRAEERGG